MSARKTRRRTSKGSARKTTGRGSSGLLRLLVLVPLVLAALSVVLVGALRWLDPPSSAFMLEHRLAGLWTEGRAPRLAYRWVDLDDIDPELALAVIAAEDQRFPEHHGFDLVELRQVLAELGEGGPSRGASTLTQQTAKNLFLWPGRDYLRKGIEAWFTVLIETLWPKRRILEVYLNIAQFGPEVYGAEAASRRYFDRSAANLGRSRAARLAAVLPDPRGYRLDRPSERRERRVGWILAQMRQLGGIAYLERLR
ncbi:MULTISPECIES: monofunctional biosynthetic peptidoglycan transglycosylase [Marichromatium]|uniref:Biosynthetic peptidoglycan transglycosylase n=1 Tax=Marichromatium gracile TaxID=1048 RepID=A0A4R4AAM4_MARGR|nr:MULTISPECIES: monofunctional biosynthetic peptidoglycan transglycosylase [Marichromatium]MBO8084656.1 monofunctional biosynthetic peptidoglycan transglycosylase [Marichromatium sp.]MBK1709133.1 monofunctional biosynthetic peptidoglycan transglycosylase [Marichromatium gracile]RNE90469.1 monofunctional biosynthetic peptidoglycan transglycosylase [Marichromatium sp. AB31]RNE93605.1 monofunctional biosynthetic peptidoglycan transglycosylase [Marichromatium sp. AB32]TCW36028.1 monofunctional bi